MSEALQVEVSVGEFFDKITILEIKLECISDEPKRENLARELEALLSVTPKSLANDPDVTALRSQIKRVNLDLWRVEDKLRAHERLHTFGEPFVALARSVYILNDQRAALKRNLNQLTGSRLVEEKSYSAY